MQLLGRVEAYLRAYGMAPSRFGRMVARDPGLVPGMRRGREIKSARLRAAIEAQLRVQP